MDRIKKDRIGNIVLVVGVLLMVACGIAIAQYQIPGSVNNSISTGTSTVSGITVTKSGTTLIISGTPASFSGTIPSSHVSGLSAVATSGSYSDILGRPTLISSATSSSQGINLSISGTQIILSGTPTSISGTLPYSQISGLANVAYSGSYSDLLNKPTLVNSVTSSSPGQTLSVSGTSVTLSGTPSAFSGTIPATQVSGLASVATSGTASAFSGTISESQVANLVSDLSGKYPNPAGTTAQYIRGDGTLATFPTTGTGSVSNVGLSSATLSITGSPVTSSGTMIANLSTAGTAGTYDIVTTDAYGRVTSGTTTVRTTGTTTRTIVSSTASAGFQISATRDCIASYTIQIAATISLSGANSGSVVLEISPNNSTWTTIGSAANAQSGTLVVTLVLTQTISQQVFGFVPAGYYVRIRSIISAGSPVFTYQSGMETLL